jgi:hypothetical protein
MLRTFAHELLRSGAPDGGEVPEPVTYARSMVEWNNAENGNALDYTTQCRQGPDGTWWDIAIVYDTRGMTAPGGDVVMCWWQWTECPSCDGHGWIDIFHPSTDGLIGHRPCPERHRAPDPVPVKATATAVPGHEPGCDGACDYSYPDGCPPF